MSARSPKRSFRLAPAALVLAAGMGAIHAASPTTTSRGREPSQSPKAAPLIGVVVTDSLPTVNGRNQFKL